MPKYSAVQTIKHPSKNDSGTLSVKLTRFCPNCGTQWYSEQVLSLSADWLTIR